MVKPYFFGTKVIFGPDSDLRWIPASPGAGDVKSSITLVSKKTSEETRSHPCLWWLWRKWDIDSHFVQMNVCQCILVCANWLRFTDKSLQRCADTKRLTACQCHRIQRSLHYKCKNEFKNKQGCELFSQSLILWEAFWLDTAQPQRVMWPITAKPCSNISFWRWNVWCETFISCPTTTKPSAQLNAEQKWVSISLLKAVE